MNRNRQGVVRTSNVPVPHIDHPRCPGRMSRHAPCSVTEQSEWAYVGGPDLTTALVLFYVLLPTTYALILHNILHVFSNTVRIVENLCFLMFSFSGKISTIKW